MRRDQTLTVSDGTLNLVAQAGDVYQTANNAKNLVLQPAPGGPVDDHHEAQLQGPRAVPAGRPDRLRRRRQLHEVRPRGDQQRHRHDRRREVRVHQRGRGHAAQRRRGRHGQPGRRLPERLLHAGEVRRDQHHRRVLDRRHDVDRGRPSAALPANAKIGVFALSNAAATNVDGEVRLRHDRRPGRRLPFSNPGDAFTGTGSTRPRWNAIVREDATQLQGRQRRPDGHHRARRHLHEQRRRPSRGTSSCRRPTTPAPTTCSRPRSPARSRAATPRAASSSTATTTTTSSSTRSPTSTRRGSTASSCAPRPPAAVLNPQPQITGVPAGTTNIWLRLTKAGNDLLGRVLVRRDDLDLGRRSRHQHAQTAPRSASSRSACRPSARTRP